MSSCDDDDDDEDDDDWCDCYEGDEDRSISINELGLLKYTECVIKETLRLFPPVPMYAREITEDCVIGLLADITYHYMS